jgi:hypothetical protein
LDLDAEYRDLVTMQTGLPPEYLIPLAFPVAFATLWLGITWLIGWTSGWHDLARRFPDRPGPYRAQFSWRSGYMGRFNAQFRSVLTLGVRNDGLRVSLLWPFAAFNKPFFVPWDQIAAETKEWMFFTGAQLTFGRPPVGTLTIPQSLWDEITKAAPRGALRI